MVLIGFVFSYSSTAVEWKWKHNLLLSEFQIPKGIIFKLHGAGEMGLVSAIFTGPGIPSKKWKRLRGLADSNARKKKKEKGQKERSLFRMTFWPDEWLIHRPRGNSFHKYFLSVFTMIKWQRFVINYTRRRGYILKIFSPFQGYGNYLAAEILSRPLSRPNRIVVTCNRFLVSEIAQKPWRSFADILNVFFLKFNSDSLFQKTHLLHQTNQNLLKGR